ncbi:MAG: gas vesicle protein K [Pseudomonadota bacterium]
MLNGITDLDALGLNVGGLQNDELAGDKLAATLASFGLSSTEQPNGVGHTPKIPDILAIDPDTVGQDLAKLVLTLVEFVRQLLEAQAIRRMDAGSLSEEQEERLGNTLYQAREKIIELADAFGIPADELTANLGPLGRLV